MAGLFESTVLGPSSLGTGCLVERILLTVSVLAESLLSLVSGGTSAVATFGVEMPNLCGERRNSGLEAYGSAVSQVTRGSKKLDSSFGVVKESKADVIGVLVGVCGSPWG